MSLAQFRTLKDKRDPLVVAPADWTILLHPWTSGASYVPSTILTGGNLLPSLDPGWKSSGELSKRAGITLTPDITTSDISGLGSLGPRLSKVTGESFSLDYEAQEWRKINLEAWSGADLSSTSFNTTSNEWRARKQSSGILRFYSALVIGFDGLPAAEVHPFFILPKVSVVKKGAMKLTDSDEASVPTTLKVYEDTAYGSLWDFGIAGPGWAPYAASAGFLAAATSITASPATVSIPVGGHSQIAVFDNNGANRTAECTFVSANPSRCTVDSAGMVTGVATGAAANVTSTLGALTPATTAVTVT